MIKKVINFIPWTISTVGLLVVFGWLIDSRFLIQIHQSFSSMKSVTAFLFILLGFQLYWIKNYIVHNKLIKTKLYVAMLSISTLIVVFTFFVHINTNLFESLINFFPINKKYDPWTTTPHLPSVLTILSFFIINISQFIIIFYRNNISKILCFGYVSLFTISGLVLLGYLTNIPWLFRITLFGGGMAIHTSILFILSGIFLLSLRFNIYKTNLDL